MNQSQIKYARERATRIKREKINDLTNRFKGTTLTYAERLKALRNGEFTVVTKKNGSQYRIEDYVSFDAETPADIKGRDKAEAEIEAAFTNFMDNLVLGDADESLEQLAAFETL